MLYGTLLHPEILSVLASAGHGSRVLIADGNYPFVTGSLPKVKIVYLNLAPGILTATDVLKVLIAAVPIETAHIMEPQSPPAPPIAREFRELLPESIPIRSLDRFAFYETVRSPDTALVIATGEQRVYANILLTIGVVPPPRA
ncbi:MAG: RbsD or FucU transport [Anaerolineae bacterium]|nr:RbsD or FucU transport [Anaerolineae bacterium]